MSTPVHTANQSEIALRITELRYHYTSEWLRKRIETLKNISLDIYSGESFGFLGPNGAGKTTTIKCILNLIKPASGQIKIFEKNHHLPEARSLVGYLPEQPYFYDHLTVAEIMHMYALLSGVPRDERSRKVNRALDRVKLYSRHKSPLRSLSKGLLQRMALAQAIVHDPKLLILDEPFSGLDPIGRKEFRELFVELKQSGSTIFMSSHILSDVEFLCERASIMVKGEIKGIFDLKRIPESTSGAYELVIRMDTHSNSIGQKLQALSEKTQLEDRFNRHHFTSREKAEQALKLAIDAHCAIESFEFIHGSLEDLFVKLVNEANAQK